MMTKREFNKSLGLAGLGAMLPAISLAKPLSHFLLAQGKESVNVALFDPRYESSQQFAKQLGSQGAQMISTNLDVGTLWFSELAQGFSQSNYRMAGLTSYADLFLLETLAKEVGCKVTAKQQHTTCESHIVQLNKHDSEDRLVRIGGESNMPVERVLYSWVLEA